MELNTSTGGHAKARPYKLLLVGVDDVVDGIVNAHAVERAPHEEDSHEHEDDTYPRSKLAEVLADSHLHGEQAEQGGELDDGVQ